MGKKPAAFGTVAPITNDTPGSDAPDTGRTAATKSAMDRLRASLEESAIAAVVAKPGPMAGGNRPTAEEIERDLAERELNAQLRLGREAAERAEANRNAQKTRDALLERQTLALETLAAQPVMPRTEERGSSEVGPAKPKPVKTKGGRSSSRIDVMGHEIAAVLETLPPNAPHYRVMTALQERARTCESPFDGVEDNGDIRWEDSQGKGQILTTDALRKRLERMKKKPVPSATQKGGGTARPTKEMPPGPDDIGRYVTRRG